MCEIEIGVCGRGVYVGVYVEYFGQCARLYVECECLRCGISGCVPYAECECVVPLCEIVHGVCDGTGR